MVIFNFYLEFIHAHDKKNANFLKDILYLALNLKRYNVHVDIFIEKVIQYGITLK
jgi:hypothetical protein